MQSSPCAATNSVDALRTSGRTVQINSRLQLDFISQIRRAPSGTYFQTLGVGAQMRRVLDENDDSGDGDHAVAAISDGFWKRSLGADPAVLHHMLRLGEKVYTIVD